MDKRCTYSGPRIPNDLSEYRRMGKWTQAEIAEGLGISRASYSLIEGGLRVPNAEGLRKLCNIFRAEPKDLFPTIAEVAQTFPVLAEFAVTSKTKAGKKTTEGVS